MSPRSSNSRTTLAAESTSVKAHHSHIRRSAHGDETRAAARRVSRLDQPRRAHWLHERARAPWKESSPRHARTRPLRRSPCPPFRLGAFNPSTCSSAIAFCQRPGFPADGLLGTTCAALKPPPRGARRRAAPLHGGRPARARRLPLPPLAARGAARARAARRSATRRHTGRGARAALGCGRPALPEWAGWSSSRRSAAHAAPSPPPAPATARRTAARPLGCEATATWRARRAARGLPRPSPRQPGGWPRTRAALRPRRAGRATAARARRAAPTRPTCGGTRAWPGSSQPSSSRRSYAPRPKGAPPRARSRAEPRARRAAHGWPVPLCHRAPCAPLPCARPQEVHRSHHVGDALGGCSPQRRRARVRMKGPTRARSKR